MRQRPQTDFDAATTLMEIGRSDSEIVQLTGIPGATVSAWRRGRGSTFHQRKASATTAWRPQSPEAYCYLLGIYLGDGCISLRSKASARLVIALDSRYPSVVAEVESAIGDVLPDIPVRRYLRTGGSVTAIHACHPALPFAFPQHGPGRKHLRRIVLAEWQRELTGRDPRPLLRGLIHSDGCRTINRFETELPSGRRERYEYPRYFFSNLSADIRAIFCDHCDLLEIRWTQSNPRNISISHRRSVARLDEFIGPKT